MRHDIEGRGTVSEAYPHIILQNFKTPLGERLANVLKHLFPVPKDDSKRIVTFSNDSDFISFRHHTYEKVPGATDEPRPKGERGSRGVLFCARMSTVAF
jgi:U3 small nucleolar ribonucleoprotein protein IMP4